MYLDSVFICLFVLYSLLTAAAIYCRIFTAHVRVLFKFLCRSLFVSTNDDDDTSTPKRHCGCLRLPRELTQMYDVAMTLALTP